MVWETTDGIPSGVSGTAYPDYAPAVQDVAALRAIPASERVDKQQRLVEDKSTAYYFDDTGAGVDDGDLIIKPADVGNGGRWFKIIEGGTPSFHAASHGGGASDPTSVYDYTVGPSSKAPYQTIQAAIVQAVADGFDNDTPARIGIFDGTYVEDLDLSPGIFLEGILEVNYMLFPQALGVEVTGDVTFDHTAASGVWYEAWLRRIFVNPSTGSALTFAGTSDKRVRVAESILDSADDVTITYGTSKAEVLCESTQLIHLSSSKAAAVLSVDQQLIMQDSAITGNPTYDAVTVDGGKFFFYGSPAVVDSLAYGRVHVLTGSSGNTVVFHRAKIWVTSGDHFTIDATMSVGRYSDACDFNALTPATVGGTNANELVLTPSPHAASHKGSGSDEIAAATTSVAGLMSAADKTKLDGL